MCLAAGGPTFPGDPPVQIHPAATIEADGYHLQSLAVDEQAGTHWAAPAHFGAGCCSGTTASTWRTWSAGRDAAVRRIDHRRGMRIRGRSGSPATVFGLIP